MPVTVLDHMLDFSKDLSQKQFIIEIDEELYRTNTAEQNSNQNNKNVMKRGGVNKSNNNIPKSNSNRNLNKNISNNRQPRVTRYNGRSSGQGQSSQPPRPRMT